MFEFFGTDDFAESLQALEQDLQARIKEKLRMLMAAENPLLFAKKLKGYKDIYRFRVGDFRIVFRLQKGKIFLLLVGHRKDIYEGL